MQPVHLDNSRLVTKSHVKLDLVPLNPSVSDSGLLSASEISETCCQRNLWRLVKISGRFGDYDFQKTEMEKHI